MIPQSIPQCFIDKIAIDREVDAVLSMETPDFLLYKKARIHQKRLSQKCAAFIRLSQGVPPINGGTPVAAHG